MRCDSVVFAGSPVTKFVLTSRGCEVAAAIERGESVDDDELVRRFVAVGAIHPFPVSGAHTMGQVTVVIPALISESVSRTRLQRLVDSLRDLSRVIVIDDHSPDPLAGLLGAEVVRTSHRVGPGAARNVGLALVDTEFVLFVDADVTITSDSVRRLLDHMTSEEIGIVAPRVCGEAGDGLLAMYESAHSPLDMGGVEANVRKGTRVSYVPSATWLCRTTAMRGIDGFDESFDTGEDVDAVWRLVERGWGVRYEPSIVVHHAARPRLRDFVRQRIGYGESAAPLATKHGDSLAPVRLSPLMLGAWLLALFSPVLAAVVFVTDVVRLTRTLATTTEERKALARLAARNLSHSSRVIASAITRTWWPIAVVLAVFSRRARVALALAALVPPALEWTKRRPTLDPIRFTALRLLDDASHGIGVWRNAIRTRQGIPLSIALGRRSRYREGR
jgi:mycofactocin system glycosyltransferase